MIETNLRVFISTGFSWGGSSFCHVSVCELKLSLFDWIWSSVSWRELHPVWCEVEKGMVKMLIEMFLNDKLQEEKWHLWQKCCDILRKILFFFLSLRELDEDMNTFFVLGNTVSRFPVSWLPVHGTGIELLWLQFPNFSGFWVEKLDVFREIVTSKWNPVLRQKRAGIDQSFTQRFSRWTI